MSNQDQPPLSTELDAEQALAELLAMDEEDRAYAIADDLKSGQGRYRQIDAESLAEALGVPEPGGIDGDRWLHFSYIQKLPASALLADDADLEAILVFAEQLLPPERYEALALATGQGSAPALEEFLTREEDAAIGAAFARDRLTSGMRDSLSGYSHYWVRVNKDDALGFETRVCDWGEVSYFLGPYDYADGEFTDTPGNCFVLLHNNGSVKET